MSVVKGRKRPRKIHPITWVFGLVLLPLLVWDVRQTVKESRQPHAISIKASRVYAREARTTRE